MSSTIAQPVGQDAAFDRMAFAAGMRRFVVDYCRPTPGIRIVVAYTSQAYTPASWIVVALRRAGADAVPLQMDTTSAGAFGCRLAAALPHVDSDDHFVLVTVELDTMSHLKDIVAALSRYNPDRWRTLRLINASREFFTHGMQLGPSEQSALNAELLHRMMPATSLRITTPAGTDLAVTLDSCKYRWLSNRGTSKRGSFVILPAGEVSTYPVNITGRLVADGAFNINASTSLDARLGDHPTVVDIADSVLTEFSCDDPDITRLVAKCLTYPHARRVGELGFGTSIGNPGYIAMNSHLNERRPGVHIGFGQHNQDAALVNYDCPIHMDLIASGARVTVGGDEDNLVDFAALEMSARPHPLDAHDEDIDADCCGLFTYER